MRTYTLALLGLAALSNAAPQFGIGDGSTILLPGGGNTPSDPVGPILLPPISEPIIKPGKRDVSPILLLVHLMNGSFSEPG